MRLIFSLDGLEEVLSIQIERNDDTASAVPGPVESAVDGPDEVELSVVGLDDVLPQQSLDVLRLRPPGVRRTWLTSEHA